MVGFCALGDNGGAPYSVVDIFACMLCISESGWGVARCYPVCVLVAGVSGRGVARSLVPAEPC